MINLKRTYAASLPIYSMDPNIPDYVKYQNERHVHCEENPNIECSSSEEMPDHEENLNEEEVDVCYQKPGEQGRIAVFDRCKQEYQGAEKDDYLD